MSTFNQLAAVALLAVASQAASGAIIVDDFESYADTAALQNAWKVFPSTPNMTNSLETNPADVQSGSRSMRLDYNEGQSPNYSIVRRTFAVDQDWSADSSWTAEYLGQGLSNSGEDLVFSLIDQDGVTIGSTTFTKATQVSSYTLAEMPLNGYTGGSGLTHVHAVQIALQANDYGSGTIWIDSITAVPEPVSGVVAGGVLVFLLKRRRLNLSRA